jgi:hypothetical protein
MYHNIGVHIRPPHLIEFVDVLFVSHEFHLAFYEWSSLWQERTREKGKEKTDP